MNRYVITIYDIQELLHHIIQNNTYDESTLEYYI